MILDKAKAIRSRIIEDYECTEENAAITVIACKTNHMQWELSNITPGYNYFVNCICKAPDGTMKPLCRSFQFVTPCTRPGETKLILQSRTRKEIKVIVAC